MPAGSFKLKAPKIFENLNIHLSPHSRLTHVSGRVTTENRSAHRIVCRRCTETKQNGDQSSWKVGGGKGGRGVGVTSDSKWGAENTFF